MIPVPATAAIFGLVGHGLTEHASRPKRLSANVDLKASGLIRTGKVEKQNPLPPGRYWIDVFQDGLPTWIGWSGGNLATVNVEKTEFFQGTSKVQVVLGWIYPWVPGDKTVVPDRAFIIFNVTSPTAWDVDVSKVLGWPNTAPQSIQTSDDTVQKPKAKGLFGSLSPGMQITVGGLGLAAVVLGASYVFRSFK